jgi:hypothetical protein
MSKKEGEKCISTKAKLTTTFVLSDSIPLGFQTLLQIHLNILKILITTIQSLVVRPHNAKGRNCYIKTW